MRDLHKIASYVQNQDFKSLASYKDIPGFHLGGDKENWKLLLGEILFPLMLKDSIYPNGEWDHHSQWFYWAEKHFKSLLYDGHRDYKIDIQSSMQECLRKGVSLSEFLNRYTTTLTTPVSDDPQEVLAQIFEEFGYQPFDEVPFNEIEWYDLLTPYFEWIEKYIADTQQVNFLIICWEVMDKGSSISQKVFWRWFSILEKKQLVEKQFSNHLTQAVEYSLRINARGVSAFAKDEFYQWLVWLDHPSMLIQAISAKLIGLTYQEQFEPNGLRGEAIIPLKDMLHLIYKKHTLGKVVAGGFINGMDFDGLHGISHHPSVEREGINIREWVLSIAIESPFDMDPYNPAAQSFWFYVHEFFDFDAEAVHLLIDNKKFELAYTCATESIHNGSLEIMKPLFKRLLNEAPKTIQEKVKLIIQNFKM